MASRRRQTAMAGKKNVRSNADGTHRPEETNPAGQPVTTGQSRWALPSAEVMAKIATGEIPVVRWSDEDLRRIEVEVPAAWKKLAQPDEEFTHQCFEKSLEFVMRLFRSLPSDDPTREGVLLVHGVRSGVMPHGWVELPGDVVFDGVSQKFYRREDYYRVTGARPLYRYTVFVLAALVLRLPRDQDGVLRGNWHGPLGLEPYPALPHTVTEKEAKELADRAGW